MEIRSLQNLKEPYRHMEITSEQRLQRFIDKFNEEEGDLTDYDCRKCRNKGVIAIIEDGIEKHRDCKCMAIRKSLRLIKKSGLGNLLKMCTFQSYNATEPWQQQIKEKAQVFIESEKKVFFIGGQVGAGKTHICTAIVGQFLQTPKAARYMMWRDVSTKLKAVVTTDEYSKQLDDFKRVEILYIDDLFKTEQGKFPTAADINIAFELLNYRYNNELITIISSEKTVNEILAIDEACGSRIIQRAGEFCFNIGKDASKNMRLKGGLK